MPDFLTPVSDMCQTQLEASRRISDAVFSGTGKIDRAVLDASHRALDEHLRYAQAVGNTRDMQVFANLQSTFWGAKPEQIQQFQQECMRIFAEIQNEVGRATQAFVEQFGTNAMRAMPFGMPMAQPRSGPSSTNPMTSMMSAWDSTLRSMSQLSGQALATAQNSARTAQTMLQAGEKTMADAVGNVTDVMEAARSQVWEEAEAMTTQRAEAGAEGTEKQDHPEKSDKGSGGHRRK